MRSFTLCLTASLVLSFTFGAAMAQAEVKIDEPTKKATAKALEYLAKKQNTDGSWSDGSYAHNTAITAYALLAFMSQGHLPNQGQYGPEVAKGARFLIAASRPADGYLVGARGGNMYCHGMASLALAELWGSTQDDEVKKSLQKAIDLIVKTQNPQGGWRYQPSPHDADISVTIMQVMALRAAKNAGLHVPDQTMKKAIAYINSCYDRTSGGYTYQPNNRAPGFARTAAGVCVLYLTGEYNAKEIGKAVEYMKKTASGGGHYWYGHYYAAHAMHQVGGKEWDEWYTKMVKELAPMQISDGSYGGGAGGRREVGPVFQTSIAVIILSVPAHYLPIFQR